MGVGPSRLAYFLGRHQREIVQIEQRTGQGSTAGYGPRATDVPVLRTEMTQQPATMPSGAQVYALTEFTFQPTVECHVGDRLTDAEGRHWSVVASNVNNPERHVSVVRAEYRGTP